MTFPLNKDEWYLKRDDRTRRISEAEGFENFRVGIIVSSEIANDFQCQVMTWIILNILARWCRFITVQIPKGVVSCLNFSKGNDFKNSIREILLQIDPFINLDFDSVKEKNVNAVCIIGKQEVESSKKSIWIDCDGWLAGMGRFPRNNCSDRAESRNILGSSYAACLGCSELFRRAIGKEMMQEQEQWYSLWDFKKSINKNELQNAPFINEWEFGHIHQPGCGAVGSSFDYFLALTEWSGSIDLVDYDHVGYSNCNRALSFTAYQAVKGVEKIEVCSDILKLNTRIQSRKFRSDYSEFINQRNFFKPPPDLILCFANQGTIWSDIQNNFPPVVFHATTNVNWGVNFGRHIPKKEWCILCRFSEESQSLHKFAPKCGKGSVVEKKGEQPILGVLPFLSPMSAILVLAEMAKMASSSYPINANFVEFSLKRSIASFLPSIGSIKEDCICKEQEIEIYPEQIKKTKYWYLVKS